MEGKKGGYEEIAMPASVLTSLRRALHDGCGRLATIHALHAAGYDAGTDAVSGFADVAEDGPAAMGEDDFWARLQAFFGRRGWGSMNHAPANDAVGVLSSSDWVEASPDEPDPEASCSFTTGFLCGFLSEVADGPVAVLEVTCRTRGDEACAFAFGSEGAVHELYGKLLDGADLDGALDAL